MIRSMGSITYGFDLGPSESVVGVTGGGRGEGYSEIKTTTFADNIAACRSDPTCPTTTFYPDEKKVKKLKE